MPLLLARSPVPYRKWIDIELCVGFVFIVMIGMKITLSFRITRLTWIEWKANWINTNTLYKICAHLCCWMHAQFQEMRLIKRHWKMSVNHYDMKICVKCVHCLECSVRMSTIGSQARRHIFGKGFWIYMLFMSSISILSHEWKFTIIIHHTQITSNIIWCRQTIQLCWIVGARACGNINRSRLIKKKINQTEPKQTAHICEYIIENSSHLWYVWGMNVYGQLVAFLCKIYPFWASTFVLKIEH